MKAPDPWHDVVREAIAGSHEAFAQLYQTFWPFALNVCRLKTNNEEDARDAAQQAFIQVHRYLHNFKFEAKFSSWLHHICVHECWGIHRKQSVRALGHATSFDSEPIHHPNLEHNHSDRLPLLEALGELTPVQYELLYLHLVEGMTHEEIAHATGVTIGTTKRGLFNTRRKIRRFLGVTNDHKKESRQKTARAKNTVAQETETSAQAAQTSHS